MAHTKNLKRAKTWATQKAKLESREIRVVAARSGYYIGHYPRAAPEDIVYAAKP